MHIDRKITTFALLFGLLLCGAGLLLQSGLARPVLPPAFVPNLVELGAAACLVMIGFGYAELTAGYRHTKQELQFTAEILKSSEKMAGMGSWNLDIANNKLVWSDEVYRIFGIDKEGFEATYEAFLQAVHPEDRDLVDNAYSFAVHNNIPYEVTHRIVRPDGETRVVQEKSETIFDANNKPLRSFGIVKDITESYQKESERVQLIAKLQKSLNEVKILRGILPICLFCKKVRGDEGYWAEVEEYVSQHSDLELQDSICPACVEHHSPQKRRENSAPSKPA